MQFQKLQDMGLWKTNRRRSNYGTNISAYFVLIIALLLNIQTVSVSGTVIVMSQVTNSSVVEFEDEPARFVPDRVSYYQMQGFAVYADPPSACTPVQLPNASLFYNITVNWILVARRLECDFQTKIENAQNAGYSAIIIHNVGSNSTAPMQVTDASKLVIYASFVGEYYGILLKDNYTYPNPYYIRIIDDFSLNSYLLPFAIVVGLCFTIMLIFMLWQQVMRWLRERRRSRRRKLPNSALKKLPVTKWSKGDPYETCAICLEDFVEQEKVRVLPCSHGYHCQCIDPWLTKGRRVCPICKRKVVLAEENFRDSESDTDDESAPLLRNASTSAAPNPASSGSTFVQQSENPFRRAQRRAAVLHSRRLRQRQAVHESDSSSISSTESQENNSHQSLPVLAEVHKTNYGGQSSSTEVVPQGSRAPFPSLQTQPSSILNSRSSSYHEINSGDATVLSSAVQDNSENMCLPGVELHPQEVADPSMYLEGQGFEGARPGIEISESEEVEVPSVAIATGNGNLGPNRSNSNNAII